MTSTADHPLLFSAPMVRALLDGRKTQTRRPLDRKGLASLLAAHRVENTPAGPLAREYDRSWPIRVRHAVGDRIWVREGVTWVSAWGWRYRADNDDLTEKYASGEVYRWKPSIHMPRIASRLTLTVTDVRVQRLQDISEADAVAEGVERLHGGFFPYGLTTCFTTFIGDREVPAQFCRTARQSYERLWESIHGGGAWQANPWVTATTFEVHRCNTDQMPGPAHA